MIYIERGGRRWLDIKHCRASRALFFVFGMVNLTKRDRMFAHLKPCTYVETLIVCNNDGR